MATGPFQRLSAALCIVAIACGGEAQNEMEETPPPAPAAAPAPALTLADVAGQWNVEVMPENADTTVLVFELTATADGSWMLMFPDRTDHIAMQATAAGDSIVTQAGPYPSALRPGVNVTTSGVMRLENGMLVGTTTARYEGAGADSVVMLRTRATRIQ